MVIHLCKANNNMDFFYLQFVKNEVHRLKDELRRVSEVVHRFPGQVNATCEDTAKQVPQAPLCSTSRNPLSTVELGS